MKPQALITFLTNQKNWSGYQLLEIQLLDNQMVNTFGKSTA